ncbi:MAG: endonuclease III [Candidatus Pacearchaeota archaeon]
MMLSHNKKDISKVMNILLKRYKNKRQPTLRRTSKNLTPFQVLIACLISLRTQDKNTEKVTEKLFKIAKTPKQFLKMDIKKLEKLIYSSGYYRKKAKTIKEVSKEILRRFKGKVPETKEELLSIKGIGQKTANIVLSFAYNKDYIPIDTHCHRIPNRLGWIKTKNPEETEKEIMKILPKKYWKEFNTIIILFGKEICLPILPKCNICPVKKYCKRINVKRYR